jgi:glutamate-1-semialdehyde aminotransferase
METIQGDGPAEGFLQGCVDIAHRYGALCVFDETKVGFRVAYGGGSEYYGIMPDLATFGKACCNGYPGSFVVGRKEILSSKRCQSAWLAATFHCDLPSLVALATVIEEMKRRDGIIYQWKIGNRLIEGVNQACEAGSLGYRLSGLGPMPKPNVTEEERDRCLAMLQGVWHVASIYTLTIRCFFLCPIPRMISRIRLWPFRNRSLTLHEPISTEIAAE